MVENEDSPRAESGKNIKSSNKTVIEDKAKVINHLHLHIRTFKFKLIL